MIQFLNQFRPPDNSSLFIYLFIYLFFEAVEDVTEIGSDLFEITHKWGFN